MKYIFAIVLLASLCSCYTVQIQEGQPYNSLREICSNVEYIKKTTVKRVIIDDKVFIDPVYKDTLDYMVYYRADSDFTYSNLLEMERKNLNDQDVIITNLIWDYYKGLGWLLFRYRRVEAVSYDVIKCK